MNSDYGYIDELRQEWVKNTYYPTNPSLFFFLDDIAVREERFQRWLLKNHGIEEIRHQDGGSLLIFANERAAAKFEHEIEKRATWAALTK